MTWATPFQKSSSPLPPLSGAIGCGNCKATCSVNIKKTGKQVDLGMFKVFLHFVSSFKNEILGGLFQIKFLSIVKDFLKKSNSFMVILSDYSKVKLLLSVSLIYVSLNYVSLSCSIGMTNGQIKIMQLVNQF